MFQIKGDSNDESDSEEPHHKDDRENLSQMNDVEQSASKPFGASSENAECAPDRDTDLMATEGAGDRPCKIEASNTKDIIQQSRDSGIVEVNVT